MTCFYFLFSFLSFLNLNYFTINIVFNQSCYPKVARQFSKNRYYQYIAIFGSCGTDVPRDLFIATISMLKNFGPE